VVNPDVPEVNMPSLPCPNAFGTRVDPGIDGALRALVPVDDAPKTRRPGVLVCEGAHIDLGRALAVLPLSAVLQMAVSSC
jgi:hypothetical protein